MGEGVLEAGAVSATAIAEQTIEPVLTMVFSIIRLNIVLQLGHECDGMCSVRVCVCVCVCVS